MATPAGHRHIASFFRAGPPASSSASARARDTPASAAVPSRASHVVEGADAALSREASTRDGDLAPIDRANGGDVPPQDDHLQPETRPVPRRPAPDSPVWQRGRRPEVVAYKRRRRKAKAKDEDDVEVEVEVEEEDVDRAAHPLAKQTDGDDPEPSAPKRARHVAGSGAPTSGVMKQLFLDLGQKNFGHVTCPTCGLLYARGEPSDERAHDAYHARAIAAAGTATRPRADADPKSTSNVIAGTGGDPCAKNWGAEGAAWTASAGDAWIVAMSPGDHPKRWAKAKSLATTTEERLGLPAGWIFDGVSAARAFAYVVGDRVAGALFAEPIRRAHRTIPDDGADDADAGTDDADAGTADTGAADTGAADSWRLSRRPRLPGGCFVAGRRRNARWLGFARVWVHPGHRRGRRHEAARRREAGRRGGVRRWGERVRVHATHRGWTVVRDASVRRRARDVPGVRVNPGGNTTGAAHVRTKDPPPSVVDATTNDKA